MKHLSIEIKSNNPKVHRVFTYGKPDENKDVIEIITYGKEKNSLERKGYFEYDRDGGLSAMEKALNEADNYIDDLK